MDAEVTCPFCGEPTGIVVDEEAGTQSFIQDCDVCCHPSGVRFHDRPGTGGIASLNPRLIAGTPAGVQQSSRPTAF